MIKIGSVARSYWTQECGDLNEVGIKDVSQLASCR